MGNEGDGYVWMTGGPQVIGGKMFHVRVHWARVEGRAIPVGLDLRSFVVEPPEEIDPANVKPASEQRGAPFFAGARGGWHEITTTVLRDLPLSAIVKNSRDTAIGLERWKNSGERAVAFWVDEPVSANAGPIERAAKTDQRPRRGPEPMIPDSVVQSVVVPAYLDGGSKPVEAVRVALERWQGKGTVTRDRAAAAVKRARRHGWLPATGRGTK